MMKPKEIVLDFRRSKRTDEVLCTSMKRQDGKPATGLPTKSAGKLSQYGSSNRKDQNALQRVIKVAQKVIRPKLPSGEDKYEARYYSGASMIIQETSQPAHSITAHYTQ